MTKHDRNWVFALVVLAIALVLGPCLWAKAYDEVKQPTCEENTIHIATAKSELKGIFERYNAATTDEQRLILGAEGDFMASALKSMTHWREVHNCDI